MTKKIFEKFFVPNHKKKSFLAKKIFFNFFPTEKKNSDLEKFCPKNYPHPRAPYKEGNMGTQKNIKGRGNNVTQASIDDILGGKPLKYHG